MLNPMGLVLASTSITQVLLGIVVLVVIIAGFKKGLSRTPQKPVPFRQKRYRMRGYGGGPNTTSVHPHQAAQGKRIVFIPGVGYRHVRATKPDKKR